MALDPGSSSPLSPSLIQTGSLDLKNDCRRSAPEGEPIVVTGKIEARFGSNHGGIPHHDHLVPQAREVLGDELNVVTL